MPGREYDCIVRKGCVVVTVRNSLSMSSLDLSKSGSGESCSNDFNLTHGVKLVVVVVVVVVFFFKMMFFVVETAAAAVVVVVVVVVFLPRRTTRRSSVFSSTFLQRWK
jgi:Flp pilus assembly protein TadB